MPCTDGPSRRRLPVPSLGGQPSAPSLLPGSASAQGERGVSQPRPSSARSGPSPAPGTGGHASPALADRKLPRQEPRQPQQPAPALSRFPREVPPRLRHQEHTAPKEGSAFSRRSSDPGSAVRALAARRAHSGAGSRARPGEQRSLCGPADATGSVARALAQLWLCVCVRRCPAAGRGSVQDFECGASRRSPRISCPLKTSTSIPRPRALPTSYAAVASSDTRRAGAVHPGGRSAVPHVVTASAPLSSPHRGRSHLHGAVEEAEAPDQEISGPDHCVTCHGKTTATLGVIWKIVSLLKTFLKCPTLLFSY